MFYPIEKAKGLNDLKDTSIGTPKEYDILIHNGTEWENSDVLKEYEVVPSKNLLPFHTSQVADGFVYIADENGYLACSSSDTRTFDYNKANEYITLPAGEYIIKAYEKTAYTSGYVGLGIRDINNIDIISSGSGAGVDFTTALLSGITFTLSSTTNLGIEYKVGNGSYAFMICTASDYTDDSSYETYYTPVKDVMWSKEQQKKNGAYNICPNDATSQVVNQITYAVDSSNKTITATWSATPSGNSPLLIAARGLLKLKAGMTYKLVGCPKGGGWSAGNFKYRVFIQDNTAITDIQDTGSGVVFTPTEDHEYTVYIAIAQHAGASGKLIFKPMVTTDLNATYDDYVSYAKTNRELTEDVNPVRCTIANFPTTAGSSYHLHKLGKLGVLDMVVALTDVIVDTWTLIGTIEVKARPVNAYFFSCVIAGTNNAMQGLIETDGSVKISSHTGGTINVRGSITYIIA